MAQVIVLVIIYAMISNDWKIGIMEVSKKSQYKYCLFKGVGVNVSLIIIHWKPDATNNSKKSSSLSHENKVDKYLLQVHINKILNIYQLILYNE